MINEKKPFDIAEFNRRMIMRLTQENEYVKASLHAAWKEIDRIKGILENEAEGNIK
jgi:hypothetical protein